MARKKYLLRDLEPVLLRAHAELISLLRAWEAMSPRLKSRWFIEEHMAKLACAHCAAFEFPRLRAQISRVLSRLASHRAEIASVAGLGWSAMPALACGQRWERDTPTGTDFFTLGTPAIDSGDAPGFALFICNIASGWHLEFATTDWLRDTFRSSNARLVAGPLSPWFAPPSR